MAGLVPAILIRLSLPCQTDGDPRVKPAGDDAVVQRLARATTP
jgi:hypothetical protein